MSDHEGREPLDEAIFTELAVIAIQALEGRRRRCLEDAPPGELYLADVPMNQMGLSIVDECRRRFQEEDAESVGHRFLVRWFALQNAIKTGRCGEFVRKTAEGMELHRYLFAVASCCPLSPACKFDESFEGRLRSLSEEDGEDKAE